MRQVTNNIYYTGVLNPNLRVFDVIMRTDYGTSYNSYTVLGSEKTAVIEASHLTFYDYFLDNIRGALAGRKLDYLVLNHCEPDHTGCVARLVEEYPDLTIVVSRAGSLYIKNITNRGDLAIQVVKDNDELSLGDKTLRFISAPFLHWPDSMFTWIPQDRALFSCDFLGCHYCEPQVTDARIPYPEKYRDALRYYFDCIFGPFLPYVVKGLDKIRELDIEYACTSHGPVLTKGGYLGEVLRCYAEWSAPVPRADKHIPIFYCTAYGNTQLIAQAIAAGIKRTLPGARVDCHNIIENDLAALTALMNESDAFLVGSPTINRDAVPPVWQLLGGMEAVNIQKRPVLVFGSFGWSGEAVPHVAERLQSVKASVYPTQLKVAFVPTPAELQKAEQLGAEFAAAL